ncbi:hypothetical protein [Bdellovibrio sp.]|uniref:hypothetical protein n=1 Tax=Bdellovibrio sp. TaxID=28201 RepID=UPI0039E4E5E6
MELLALPLLKLSFLFLTPIFISACSIDAAILGLGHQSSSDLEVQNRKEPDFIYGEVVTTHGGRPGYQVKAVFGEISEKTSSLNGNKWQIEGVFYE